MLGESQTAMAVAVEMQNRSLQEALRAGAKDERHQSVRTHIEHFVEGYSRLLEYRNYYVHTLLMVGPDGGRLLSLSAKGKLRYDEGTLSMADIEMVKNQMLSMIAYVSALEREMGATGDGLTALIEAYGASLQKPQWPERLKRNSVFLQEL